MLDASIGELIGPGTRVLDLGCGEGDLLAWLKERKKIDGRGVEMTGARVQKAIARGVSVYQGDLESAEEEIHFRAAGRTGETILRRLHAIIAQLLAWFPSARSP